MFKFLSQNDMELSTVIVMSPLVALMHYQAAQLTKKGARAVYLQDVISKTSNSPQITLEDISSGKCDVVFAIPEPLLGEFRSLLVKIKTKIKIKTFLPKRKLFLYSYVKQFGSRSEPTNP